MWVSHFKGLNHSGNLWESTMATDKPSFYGMIFLWTTSIFGEFSTWLQQSPSKPSARPRLWAMGTWTVKGTAWPSSTRGKVTERQCFYTQKNMHLPFGNLTICHGQWPIYRYCTYQWWIISIATATNVKLLEGIDIRILWQRRHQAWTKRLEFKGLVSTKTTGDYVFLNHEMQRVPADVSIRSDHPSTPNTQTHAPRGQAFGIVH